jgi:putative heme-binding domain-containing protein
MEGGLWRYAPTTGSIDVLTTGTTNPWGHDWTAEGECFFVNTVNGHLWHLIPGAHFAQANGIDPNPLTYALIDQHADHYHFDTGRGWTASRDGSASDLGGGHAHSGCLIYGGSNWPESFCGRLFTLNFHGRRLNRERLERFGSGYVARHEPDCFGAGDPWFRGIDLAAAPDGSVVVLDWSDTGECHESDGVHRSSGRIYRFAHGTPVHPALADPSLADLGRLDAAGLVRLQSSPDEWLANRSRLVLREQRPSGGVADRAALALRELFDSADSQPDGARPSGRPGGSALRVRALLSLEAIGRAEPAWLVTLLDHDDEHVRTWAVRLLTQHWPLDAALGPVPSGDPALPARVEREWAALAPVFRRAAREDSSGLVRLALASTLQRLPVGRRPDLARALVSREEDADDHNLPLLVWYGLMPVADADPQTLVDVALECRWPLTRRLIARRLAERIRHAPDPLDRLLAAAAAAPDPANGLLADLLAGLAEGLAGWRSAPRPRAWPEVTRRLEGLSSSAERDRLVHLADDLGAVFGDGRSVEAVRRVAADPKAPIPVRTTALESLLDTLGTTDPGDLRALCEGLLADRHLRAVAARGLARFDDPAIAEKLVEACRATKPEGRGAIVSLLVSRPSFARALLAAIRSDRLPIAVLTAFDVRRIHALGDAAVSQEVTAVWGQLRESPEEKLARIEELRTLLSDGPPHEGEGIRRGPSSETRPSSEGKAAGSGGPSANLASGRRLYAQHCGGCHRLYGEGGSIGPDLTGSGRHDLGYLLENLVDPGAVVNRDWRLSTVVLHDGRVLGGILTDSRDETVVLQTPTERLVLVRDDIDSVTLTDRSPMPEGLLDRLTPEEIRDLVGYLRHPAQVPPE